MLDEGYKYKTTRSMPCHKNPTIQDMHGRIKRADFHDGQWSQHVDAGRFDTSDEAVDELLRQLTNIFFEK
jgi:hypothetical protein